MRRSFVPLCALLLGGCYLAHGVEDAPSIDAGAPRADAARLDAGRPDAGPPPPELVCLDDFDHAAEAERVAASIEVAGFGAGAAERTHAGLIVEVSDERLVLEREDGTRETFVAEGLALTEELEAMTQADWGVGPDGWHFVRSGRDDTRLWVRAFDGGAPPEPFWQRSTELRFEPACAQTDRCGDDVHQFALLADRGWAPVHVAHAGERLDIETGTWLFLIAHVGSTDAALACGEPTPHFRGVVTVMSREPCVC